MLSLFKKWVSEWRDGAVDWDQLEALLIQSDLGVELTELILAELRNHPVSAKTVSQQASKILLNLWKEPIRTLEPVQGKSNVWLVIGINGTGKTTSIAKLAHRYKAHRPFLVAADTFRAAAIEQLKIWSTRLDVPIFCGQENGDPAAAAYQGIQAAQEYGAGLVLIDTAGRLHNKENLMREMSKVKKVISKLDSHSPQETLLVVDGMNGLNAVQQAKEFHQALALTAVIATKMDSSSKGGVIAALKHSLNLDTLMVGYGESTEDMKPFSPADYVRHFFDDELPLAQPIPKEVENTPTPILVEKAPEPLLEKTVTHQQEASEQIPETPTKKRSWFDWFKKK